MRKKWMSLLLVAAMVVTACTQGTGETAQNKVAERSGIGDDLYKNPVVSEKRFPYTIIHWITRIRFRLHF